ncbi:centrosome and spindle pole-associated protein 1 [Boleophthalmus pectinirostris]|uniref:centrosome and spindle pole-associated protein 1 n=1 Tax=Boleophthalmus pectinirostris TaxID=150288 RepID=UPI002431A102|nr:centrosome and spindle pole-associated protein 1 [Boleophthalmus pectinirostris]
MEDDLENFLRERKARLAKDKASLQQFDPPYMEIKSRPQRSNVTTVKENIPPETQAQEDESNLGLPLGLEYEKKKQKLQRECRKEYRQYITQKAQRDYGDPEPLSLCNGTRLFKPSLVPSVRPPSRRDAATLTEDTRGQERAQDRAESCVDLETETKNNEGQKCNAAESGNNKTDWEKRDIRFGRRSQAATRSGDEEFATGLMIGAANTEEILQKKKERYRKELQEQIAEQLRNKKRERELELKVAATGANDPEKLPDRIRQFGLQRRREERREAAVETDFPLVPVNMKTVADKETPAPELPPVAFQSPILDYGSALGLYSVNQPNGPVYPRTMDTPRISLYPPHPSSTLGDVYRSPPYEAPPSLHHHHYYSRNPPEPQTPFYNHLSVPGGVHVPYWNVPPGGAVSTHYGNHSPHSQHSESSFPDPPPHPPPEVTTADSRVAPFPSDKPRSARERILNYRDALKQQIQERQEQRRVEREERERHEAQLEEDLRRHEPWGRGGGGAPLRDSTGNLIADLKRMHRQNEEAYSRPEQRRAALMRPESDPNERVNGTVSVCSEPDTSDRINGFTHVQTPQFARGSVFSAPPSQQQLQEQDKYKAYLKLQIDEKMRKKAEERERMRLEEEKEEKRLAEQRERIQKEFEEEQERKRRKEQEQKAKNEELIRLAEERKREAERKKKEEEERESEALRRRQERERQVHVTEVCRAPSPPIPTLQKKLGLSVFSPRPPTVESQQSLPPLSERSLSGLQSPPVPARRNQLRAAGKYRDVFSELSALRRQLRTEQKRLEGRLQQDWDLDLESPLSDRQRERPQVDVFDMARLKLQAPVRRPSSRSTEPKNLPQIHDSLQLKYNDVESRLGSGQVPKHVDRDPFNSQRSTVQGDYFDFSPTHHNDYARSALGGPSRCSLLESDSTFIEPLGEAFSALPSPEQKRAPMTARERRRLAEAQRQTAVCSAPEADPPPHTGGRGNPRNRGGAGRHRAAAGHRGNTDVVDSDDSPPPPDPDPVQKNTWRRMGTSDTIDGPIRRESA